MSTSEKQNDVTRRRARRAALEKLSLTDEEKTRWVQMMTQTWGQIASDAEEVLGGVRRSQRPALVVELVCNANRMMMFAGMTREEDEFLSTQYSRPSFQRWARGVMANY